jgi:hypothetical protein
MVENAQGSELFRWIRFRWVVGYPVHAKVAKNGRVFPSFHPTHALGATAWNRYSTVVMCLFHAKTAKM